jgi:hypothetical protein
MSILELVSSFCDTIALYGRSGVAWQEVMAMYGDVPLLLQPKIIKLLEKRKFVFAEVSGTQIVTPPENEIWQSLGFTSRLHIPSTDGLPFLEFVGRSKQRGLTHQEAIQLLDKKINLYPTVDKLYAAGLIAKTVIAPFKGAQNPRSSTRANLYHLPRFSALYDPAPDEMLISLEEAESESLQASIINILQTKYDRRIALQDLAPMLGYRVAKDLRKELGQCITQLKGKALIEVIQAPSSNGIPVGYVREIVPEEGEEEVEGTTPAHTLQHMCLFEQAVYWLNASPNGLTTTALKKLLGVNMKRSYWLHSSLIKNAGFRSELVQIGRQKAINAYGPDPFVGKASFVDNGACDLPSDSLPSSFVQTGSPQSQQAPPMPTPDKPLNLDLLRRQVFFACLDKVGGGREVELCVCVCVCAY